MTLIYTITLFLSAALLFSVQPMVGKMILPHLGGAPAVWNACMVFFQAALLAGYAYAHATSSLLGARRQAVAHLGLLIVAACICLPIIRIIDDSGARENPTLWLLGGLAATVGLPFVVLAGSAPMLQRWFAVSGHQHARDPYFLYAASNAGSLLALAAYPTLIEPTLALDEQSRLWRGGFVLLILLTGCSAALVKLNRTTTGNAEPRPRAKDAVPSEQTVSWSQRARWLALSAIPSSLMLGVTAHITTNIAAVPLLWVAPLAVYLLTFILVFARRQLVKPLVMERLLPVVALVMAPLFFVTLPELEGRLVLAHLAMFFIASMVCHARLAAQRPHAARLTEYYLWLAAGGVVGGMVNAMLAPVLFDRVIEYPVMIAAACLARGRETTHAGQRREGARAGTAASRMKGKASAEAMPRRTISPTVLDLAWPAGVLIVGMAGIWFVQRSTYSGTWGGLAGVSLPVIFGAGLAWRHRGRFALSYAAALVVIAVVARLGEGRTLYVERNFFGVKRVMTTPDGMLHTLYHGTTVHGMQWRKGAWASEPLAYYHRVGPVGDVFRQPRGQGNAQVAVVGLGAGAVAAYARPNETFTYIEIDPAVARIARDPGYFTFLPQAPSTTRVLVGDGRVVLADQPDAKFDLIFLDAYSSDAVPTHLLSRQALDLYLAKLTEHGLLAFHITNRLMDFEPVIANVALPKELVVWIRRQSVDDLTEQEQSLGAAPAHVVAVARDLADLGDLPHTPGWRPARPDPSQRVWTDDYADVFGLLRRGLALR